MPRRQARAYRSAARWQASPITPDEVVGVFDGEVAQSGHGFQQCRPDCVRRDVEAALQFVEHRLRVARDLERAAVVDESPQRQRIPRQHEQVVGEPASVPGGRGHPSLDLPAHAGIVPCQLRQQVTHLVGIQLVDQGIHVAWHVVVDGLATGSLGLVDDAKSERHEVLAEVALGEWGRCRNLLKATSSAESSSSIR